MGKMVTIVYIGHVFMYYWLSIHMLLVIMLNLFEHFNTSVNNVQRFFLGLHGREIAVAASQRIAGIVER